MPTAQSVMLAIHCKKTDTVDLKSPVLSYIRHTYSDREAEDAEDDIVKVQDLRAEIAVANPSATSASLRESLSK